MQTANASKIREAFGLGKKIAICFVDVFTVKRKTTMKNKMRGLLFLIFFLTQHVAAEKRCPFKGRMLPELGQTPEKIYIYPEIHDFFRSAVGVLRWRLEDEFGKDIQDSPLFPEIIYVGHPRKSGFKEIGNGWSEVYFAKIRKENHNGLATGFIGSEIDIQININFLHQLNELRSDPINDLIQSNLTPILDGKGKKIGNRYTPTSTEEKPHLIKLENLNRFIEVIVLHEFLHSLGIFTDDIPGSHYLGYSKFIMSQKHHVSVEQDYGPIYYPFPPYSGRFHYETLNFLNCRFFEP